MRVPGHWLSAIDTLFSLLVKATLENRHYPILKIRKTQSLYDTICSTSHGYFVTELGFKSLLSQSEPLALSHLWCADSQMRFIASIKLRRAEVQSLAGGKMF